MSIRASTHVRFVAPVSYDEFTFSRVLPLKTIRIYENRRDSYKIILLTTDPRFSNAHILMDARGGPLRFVFLTKNHFVLYRITRHTVSISGQPFGRREVCAACRVARPGTRHHGVHPVRTVRRALPSGQLRVRPVGRREQLGQGTLHGGSRTRGRRVGRGAQRERELRLPSGNNNNNKTIKTVCFWLLRCQCPSGSYAVFRVSTCTFFALSTYSATTDIRVKSKAFSTKKTKSLANLFFFFSSSSVILIYFAQIRFPFA